MDLNRIDKELRTSIENTPFSLEIDLDAFLNDPAIIQQERARFGTEHPVIQPADIRVKDLYIASSKDDYKIRLHICQADGFDENQVILYFHGGGYVFGLPEQVDAQMFRLAEEVKGTIISVDYRLSPQHRFPVPVLDGFDALNWVIKKGREILGVNTGNITVFGASAGAHLAAAVAQMAVDKAIPGIKHQFLLYPVIHNRLNTASMNEFTDAWLWNKSYAAIAWTHFLGKENIGKKIRYADLTIFDKLQQLPKTTIVAAELDPLRDENIEYAQLLWQAGVPTELWVVPGALHVFDLFPSALTEEFFKFLVARLQ